ncbi:MAG: SAM-dependent methyltransferase [Clostridia bacterium]|nr:SAM-dependent methyltransferase [Clostridia bacterium]
MGRDITTPSTRLVAAARIAAASLYDGEDTDNLVAIDVGCDHAKLAIYLVQSGICQKVTASDINEGPVSKARENVSRRTLMGAPLSDYIDIVLTDGLTGLSDRNANRIFILGMGGEVISGILDRADFVRNDVNKGKIKFILQPMTSEDKLREYLLESGYNILDEEMVLDKERVYAVMSVCFDGIKREYTPAQLLLGKSNIEKGGELFCRQLDRRIRITEKAIADRKKAELDCSELENLLREMQEMKEKTT